MRSRGVGARNIRGENGGKGTPRNRVDAVLVSHPWKCRTVSAMNFRAPHDLLSPRLSEVRSQATGRQGVQVLLAPRIQQSTGSSLAETMFFC